MVIFLKREQFAILVGKRIRELREEKEWTREELAERSELHENSIKEIELGKKIPSFYTVHKLSLSLEIELEDLVSEI